MVLKLNIQNNKIKIIKNIKKIRVIKIKGVLIILLLVHLKKELLRNKVGSTIMTIIKDKNKISKNIKTTVSVIKQKIIIKNKKLIKLKNSYKCHKNINSLHLFLMDSKKIVKHKKIKLFSTKFILEKIAKE
jgi:hypothetical protein